ncbi:MAG: PAS domain-containing sensor histidine kinase, partial [Acidobacteria bacterium]|nr:PAS domain-containing sensor histidine kinase [Acidobacteriota bacterium]
TGLGLAVTYGIIQEHGGSIDVTSQPGDGTTFRLVFPPIRLQAKRAVG